MSAIQVDISDITTSAEDINLPCDMDISLEADTTATSADAHSYSNYLLDVSPVDNRSNITGKSLHVITDDTNVVLTENETSSDELCSSVIDLDETIHQGQEISLSISSNAQQCGIKKKRLVTNWKANLCKQKCNNGLRYIHRAGELVTGHKLKSGCTKRCRFKCHEHFSVNKRSEIFSQYWNMGDLAL